MDWFSASDYQLTRLVIERGLGLTYLLAFLVALNQFPALLGERGLLPVPRYLGSAGFGEAPSLFHLRYSDRLLRAVALTGVALSVSLVLGLLQAGPLWLPMLGWFVLWVLYLSIVNVGQRFYAFGWESLLLEAGFLAIFLGNARTAPALPDPHPLPLARLSPGARRRAHQAPGRSLLARSHLHGLPPRDPADAEPAQLVCPPAAARLPPDRGPRQLRRPARRAVPAVPAAAYRDDRWRS